MGFKTQFYLLLYKNWKLQIRKYKTTLAEILVPIFLVIVLLMLRRLVNVEVIKEPTSFVPIGLESENPMILSSGLAYTPNTIHTTQVMALVGEKIVTHQKKILVPLKGFDTEAEMVDFLLSSQINGEVIQRFLGGVVFSNPEEWQTGIPHKISYSLRFQHNQRMGQQDDWETYRLFPPFFLPGPRGPNGTAKIEPDYVAEGFLSLQYHLHRSVAEVIDPNLRNRTEDWTNPRVKLLKMPYPPYISDPYISALQQQFPFIMIMSFIFMVLTIPKDVVLEKEAKLKEAMKMMGMSGWLQWIAWFIRYFSILLVTTLIMANVLVTPGTGERNTILTYSSMTVVWMFLILYAISFITYGFMISAFFNKGNAAAGVSGLFYFLTYLPWIFIGREYSELTFGVKMAVSLLNNQAMGIGWMLLGKWESSGVGFQWNNIWQPVTIDDNMSIGYMFLMLIVDSIIHMLICLYVEAVKPGNYGAPQPFYFFLLPSYWCGTKQKGDIPDHSGERSEFFEPDPPAHAGIQIRGLTKHFGKRAKRKTAVDNLSLNMYENQITALLGHNGAGKTTTMFMLTGFFPPSAGTAFVNGYDIRKDLTNVRSSLGLCPQHDILFDLMTVEEHLYIFAKLKGCEGEKIKEEVDYYIKTLGLEEKRNQYSRTLSGGQKRKLSVGIALIGDSKIVILDEPTSGMDPSARRVMWDVLQSQRKGRTMILSTHFMDEADALGDRIAIMADGIVQCCGSSLFLKKKYGAGYHLVLTKKPTCNVNKLTNIITELIPEAKLENNVGAELSFILPNERVSIFPQLFTKLETDKDALGILGFGASITTMEEVFIKVGEGLSADQEERLHQTVAGTARGNGYTRFEDEEDRASDISLDLINPSSGEETQKASAKNTFNSPKNHGLPLISQQYRAMLIKRMLYTMRNKVLTLSQVLLPLIFTALTIVIIKVSVDNRTAHKLHLDLNLYGNTKVIYNNDFTGPYTDVLTNASFQYARQFVGSQHETIGSTNTSAAILKRADKSMKEYNAELMIAEGLNAIQENNLTDLNRTIYAMFNPQPYHTAPLAVVYTDTGLIRALINDSYSFEAFNHPLPETASSSAISLLSAFSADAFSYSTNIMFGFSFLAASFVVFLITERSSKAKHSQTVSGVKWYTFWFSTYCWDLVNYIIPAMLTVALYAVSDIKQMADVTDGKMQPLYVIVLLILYGFALLPTMYVLHFLFSGAASGYVAMVFYNLLTGVVPSLTILILRLALPDQQDVVDAVEYAFTALFPGFNLGQGMQNIFTNYNVIDTCFNAIPKQYQQETGKDSLFKICDTLEMAFNRSAPQAFQLPCCKGYPETVCGDNCLSWQENYFAWESLGIGRPLVFLAIQFVAYWLIVIVIETELLRKLFYLCRPKVYVLPERPEQEDDEDVIGEKTKILYQHDLMETQDNPVVIRGLTKYFANNKAVDDIYLTIPRGECFGLLGVNGAGKTTTFRMLTGDETMSGGTAFMNGLDIKTDIHQIQKKIGYCPQFDALIDQMTGEETLYMYARLRGVPEGDIASVVKELLSSLLLDKHATKLTKDYSGGNKRKLSTAIALMGEPSIVFLDEPTTGMDPVARRMLWEALSKVRDSGKTLILTSHSMEECEALCTRMAIMVNGRYRCLGATQHLKNKFGAGYTLVARISYPEDGSMPDLKAVEDFVANTFDGATLKDKHQNLLQYQISRGGLSWAEVFAVMEENKDQLHIEDYSVSQTTLEQVFINFARAQVPPDEKKPNCGMRMRQCCCLACLPEYVVDSSAVAEAPPPLPRSESLNERKSANGFVKSNSQFDDQAGSSHSASEVAFVDSNSQANKSSPSHLVRPRSSAKVAPEEMPDEA